MAPVANPVDAEEPIDLTKGHLKDEWQRHREPPTEDVWLNRATA
jgi:hypothetical protein